MTHAPHIQQCLAFLIHSSACRLTENGDIMAPRSVVMLDEM
jgi:hypothetical protein